MAAEHLAGARNLIHSGDLQAAELRLLESLSAAPTADAWYELGAVRFARGEAQCSLAAFTAAAAFRTPRGEDLRMVALDYVLLHDLPDAEHWLRAAVQAEPGNAEAWYDLGRTLYEEKRYNEASGPLQHALALEPVGNVRRPRATTYLGLIAETNNDTQRAETDYRAAIAAQEGSEKPFFLPYRALGILLRGAGQRQEATELLRQAVRLAPGDPVNHAELASCYVNEGALISARDEFQTAIRLHPSRPAWHFQLARVYQAMGQREAAAKEFAIAKSEIDVAPSEAPDQ